MEVNDGLRERNIRTFMLDEIIGTLKEQVGSSLMEKVGLDQTQSDNSISAAANSVQDLLGTDDGLDIGDVLNLFSKESNTAGADGILGQLGETFMGKLTGEVGLASNQASGVKDLILPLLTSLLSEKIGGDKGSLMNMLGGLLSDQKGGGIGSLLGGASKLFGK